MYVLRLKKTLPGESNSGTTRIPRIRANSRISLMSSCV